MSTEIVIDLETIPDQTDGAIEAIAETLEVKVPKMLKPELIDALGLGSDGKSKNVAELNSMWIEEFGEAERISQAKEKWLKTSFDGGKGQICAIGYDAGNGEECLYGDERRILADFWLHVREVLDGKQALFIAHNAKFDLPFLYHRSVVHGIKPTARGFKPHGRHDQHHFCTMEAWAGYGNRISLNNLAGILGLGSKTEGMSGDQVCPEYQKGNIDKIAEYCKQDVALCKAVYDRLTFGGE